MNKTITLFILLLVCFGFANAQTTLFSQNFNSSTTIGDYVNAGGEANKFTGISSTSNNNPISAANNTVRFTKAGSSSGYFSRNVNLSATAAKVIQFEFDFQVLIGSTAGTTQAQMYFGNGFTNTATVPSGSQAHSKIVFDFGISNDFSVKSSTSPTTPSALYATKQKLIWIINNSGTAITYTAPDGITQKLLADDQWDLYVGASTSTPVLADRDALSTGNTNDLQNFYFSYPTGSENATLELDNFVIKDLTSVLPINLVAFTANAKFSQNELNWTTAGESNNSHFEIMRSANAKDYTIIGKVNGSGTCVELKNYRFIDYHPLAGLNYYQLKQVDNDGNARLYAAQSVINKINTEQFNVYSTSQGVVQVNILSAKMKSALLQIRDLKGAVILSKQIQLNEGENTIVLPFASTKGVYLFTLSTADSRNTVKFVY